MNVRQRAGATVVSAALVASTLTIMASTASTADDEQPWPRDGYDLTWAEPWLYFIGNSGNADELWRTNGPVLEHVVMTPDYPDAEPSTLTPFDGALYVTNDHWGTEDSTFGWWRIEPDNSAPTLVTPGHVGDAVVWDEWLYYGVDTSAGGTGSLHYELRRTDGTTDEMLEPFSGAHLNDFTVADGWLYFTATMDSSSTVEVWRTDGTEVTLVDAVSGSSGGRWVEKLSILDEWVYLHTEYWGQGEDHQGSGFDLWRTNGNGAHLLTADTFGYDAIDISRIEVLGDNLYVTFWYAGSDTTEGFQVQRTDGEDWFLVADSAGWSTLVALGDWVYLSVITDSEGALWRTNGTTTEAFADHDIDDSELALLDGWVYFTLDSDDHGEELWRADGADAHLVADLNPGPGDSYPYNLVVIGDWLYFVASSYDSNHSFVGHDIWRTNGTQTQRVRDVSLAPPEEPEEPEEPEGPEEPEEPEQPSFTDVGEVHPFITQITWLAQSGIAEGYEDGTFRPAAHVSRQAMAAFLYRAAGEPAFTAPAEASFTDVATTHPFSHEIEWLAQSGITQGYDDGTFRPGAHVSRQAMAAFLYRYEGEPAFTSPAEASFTDVATAHDFFDEVEWLVDAGITEGYDDGTFRPGAHVSRQAMAAFLHRLIESPGPA